MARLLRAASPFGNRTPHEAGGVRLSFRDPGPATSIAPFRGREEAVAAALRAALPSPRRTAWLGGTPDGTPDGARLFWWGPGRWLLVGRGAPAGLEGIAAVVDQGDGIACAVLEGPGARDALARLVPLDLRDAAFPDGAVARTLLNHMAVTLSRLGDAWEVMAPRSMAGTLAEEVEAAMRAAAARGAA